MHNTAAYHAQRSLQLIGITADIIAVSLLPSSFSSTLSMLSDVTDDIEYNELSQSILGKAV